MTRNPYLDPAYAARLRALEEEDEEGLTGLVPVDRILATLAGLLGGALTAAVAIALEAHVRAVRRRSAR